MTWRTYLWGCAACGRSELDLVRRRLPPGGRRLVPEQIGRVTVQCYGWSGRPGHAAGRGDGRSRSRSRSSVRSRSSARRTSCSAN